MKFLAIAKPKDSASMLPPAVTRQLLEMSMAAMKQLKKDGKQLEAYVSPAGCFAVILDYKSSEEWVKNQLAIPILTYYNQEIYPLADMEELMKAYIEALKAAEKMMAGAPR